jgi:VanZ family protein
LPALAWTAVVLGASSDQFSASNTGTFIITALHFVLPSAAPSTIELLHLLIRKSAHLFEYGILGLLYLRAQRSGDGRVRMTSLWISLAICLVVASLDEIHQSFVPSRTGTWHDVVLDVVGAVMFQVIAVGVMRDPGR